MYEKAQIRGGDKKIRGDQLGWRTLSPGFARDIARKKDKKDLDRNIKGSSSTVVKERNLGLYSPDEERYIPRKNPQSPWHSVKGRLNRDIPTHTHTLTNSFIHRLRSFGPQGKVLVRISWISRELLNPANRDKHASISEFLFLHLTP